MNVFEKATKAHIRFDSPTGYLSVEDLWDIPLTSKRVAATSLNAIANAVSKELKELAEDDFITEQPNPRRSQLELQLDVLKRVRDVRLEEAQLRAAQEKKAAEAQRIMEAYGSVQGCDDQPVE